MAVTLRDVARAAGVSASAVSRSYTEGAPVSAETRARVMEAAERLGYLPNRLASSLTTGRTRLIGLVADDFGNPFFLKVIDLFTRGLQERGFRPLVVHLGEESGAEAAVRSLREYAVEAAVIVSATLPPTVPRAFKAAGVPLVHAFSRATGDPDSAQVGISDAQAGRMAAKVLGDRGYRRLGFVGGPERAMTTRDRFNGFRNMATRQEQTVTAAFAPAFSFAAGRAAMEAILAEGGCDACFCADDVLALGAMAAVRAAGLRVPEDIGILGLNDSEMAGWDGIDLTTIAQPTAQIVAAAVDLAIARAASRGQPAPEDAPAGPEVQSFPCLLVERGTLRPAPGGRQSR